MKQTAILPKNAQNSVREQKNKIVKMRTPRQIISIECIVYSYVRMKIKMKQNFETNF